MSSNNIKTYVTKPTLPNLEDLLPYLHEIWENKILTNNGPFHNELEKQIAIFLKVPYVSLFANGTLALLTALQALKITGEVITTPYSFVATSHAILWNKLKPVFVDIEKETCNLNPNKIEAAITSSTQAIVPVHIYGNPCNVNQIQNIADTYGLKVIYDAAQSFGVKLNSQSILNFGDLSTVSFHATKVFNTLEGGAIISHDSSTKKRIDYLKNFGFADEVSVIAPGINSKMNEIQAAVGLLQLKNYKQNHEKRAKVWELYSNEINTIPGVKTLDIAKNVSWNYAYFPIFIDENKFGSSRDQLYELLKNNGIYGRRYFYPLISDFTMYRHLKSAKKRNLPVAEKISASVICLPIYSDLPHELINEIIEIIKNEYAKNNTHDNI